MHSSFLPIIFLFAVLEFSEAILGGWTADPVRDRKLIQSFTHFGSVSEGPVSNCGGVLISWKHVAVAAHCDVQPIEHVAFIGTSYKRDVTREGVAYVVEEVIRHPGYGTHEFNGLDDIMIVVLHRPSKQEMKARGVGPAPMDWKTHTWYPGKTAQLRITGFGSTSQDCRYPLPSRLQLGNSYTTSCQKYPQYFPGGDPYRQMCFNGHKGGQVTCKGDSGSPIYYKSGNMWVAAAITSGGQKQMGRCCIEREMWHAINLAGYRDWITDVVRGGRRASCRSSA